MGPVIARGDRRQRSAMPKGEPQRMNGQVRYCFEKRSPDEGREHPISSKGARFLPSSERAWKRLLHHSPSKLAPRIPPSKLAAPLWPNGMPTQRRS